MTADVWTYPEMQALIDAEQRRLNVAARPRTAAYLGIVRAVNDMETARPHDWDPGNVEWADALTRREDYRIAFSTATNALTDLIDRNGYISDSGYWEHRHRERWKASQAFHAWRQRLLACVGQPKQSMQSAMFEAARDDR